MLLFLKPLKQNNKRQGIRRRIPWPTFPVCGRDRDFFIEISLYSFEVGATVKLGKY